MGKSLKILEDPEILTRHLNKSEATLLSKRLQFAFLKMALTSYIVDLPTKKVVIVPSVFFYVYWVGNVLLDVSTCGVMVQVAGLVMVPMLEAA